MNLILEALTLHARLFREQILCAQFDFHIFFRSWAPPDILTAPFSRPFVLRRGVGLPAQMFFLLIKLADNLVIFLLNDLIFLGSLFLDFIPDADFN